MRTNKRIFSEARSSKDPRENERRERTHQQQRRVAKRSSCASQSSQHFTRKKRKSKFLEAHVWEPRALEAGGDFASRLTKNSASAHACLFFFNPTGSTKRRSVESGRVVNDRVIIVCCERASESALVRHKRRPSSSRAGTTSRW